MSGGLTLGHVAKQARNGRSLPTNLMAAVVTVRGMARPHRPQVAGGVYHITARGNRRQPIFLDDRDRHSFLTLLEDVVGRHGWRIHAYCLMPNHFHLLVETTEANISIGMQRLNFRYAQWFNHRHDLDGHLFQGRFHSVLAESTWYVVELARYIVLNPVRAGLCQHPGEWRWSSYRATIGQSAEMRVLTVDWLLGLFGKTSADARRAYEAFVMPVAARSRSP